MSVETTATDFPVVGDVQNDVTDREFDAHMVSLLLHEPFFSALLRRVTKVKTEAVPTAGVTVKDGEFKLFWNPKFVGSLEKKEVRGLLKHESYHLIFDHCVSRKKEPHMLWNWATDLAINSLIPMDELPEGGLRPGQPLDLSKIDKPDLLAKWQKVSDFVETLELNLAAEQYFKMLQDNEDIRETIEQPGEGSFVLDDHEGWDTLSDEEKQIAKGKIKQALAEAVKKADQSNQWGSIGSETREKLRKMATDQINWKKVLHNFCGRSQRANKSRTHRKVNRKYPYVHPGVKRGHTSNLAIYFDQSGSVSHEECALFFGALTELSKITTFNVFPFDWNVDEENAFVWRRGQKIEPGRTRSGGTNFKSVQEHFDNNCDGFDGLIILTDGEAADPGPSRKRRCWVVLPGRRLMFDPHPNDVVVNMQRES